MVTAPLKSGTRNPVVFAIIVVIPIKVRAKLGVSSISLTYIDDTYFTLTVITLCEFHCLCRYKFEYCEVIRNQFNNFTATCTKSKLDSQDRDCKGRITSNECQANQHQCWTSMSDCVESFWRCLEWQPPFGNDFVRKATHQVSISSRFLRTNFWYECRFVSFL